MSSRIMTLASHAALADPRPVLRALHALVAARPSLKARYEDAKRVVRAFRKPAFYEITQRCNLFCEGCYYFEGGLTSPVTEESSGSAWRSFFAAEAARGVTMAYFVGAEPALHQERLLAAAEHFPYGNIGTNGTIRLHPDIPYRIGVSVWAGEEETDKRLRGGAVFRKAFRNYAGDRRAIILYTISPWNLHEVRAVAHMCRDNGLPLTFNLYSPTASFLDKLARGASNDDAYFRVSQPGATPCFSNDDLARTRGVVAGLMADFPDTVLYTPAYNDWATQPGSLYEIDAETGVATHCGSRIVGQMRYHGSDLSVMEKKCCTPDIDCSQCRMYSGGWSSKFQPAAADVADEAAFGTWLDMIETLGRIFLIERDTAPV